MHYLTFDIDSKVKATQKFAQFPLHYVIYAPEKFAVAASNCLGGAAFTTNGMDLWMHAQTDRRTMNRLWNKINILFFLKIKVDIINIFNLN